MKYAIDELRLGRWERIGGRPPLDKFDSRDEANKFIDRLIGFFPMRQWRIVEVEAIQETQAQ